MSPNLFPFESVVKSDSSWNRLEAQKKAGYVFDWNSNGTLAQLVTTDQIYPANSQVCTFSYDDLIRLETDNCGTHWNESSAYDPFSNVTKSGSFPWPSGGYSQLTNRYASTAFTYDTNGRLTNDSFDALGWDVFGNLTAQSGTNIIFDAQDRTFSTTTGGVSTMYIYAPDGGLVGTSKESTKTVQQMFVALPNSRAVYVGGVLSYFDHYDWQGSARVSSTWARGVYSDISYDAFGMPYWTSGTSNNQYAGLTSDFSTGTEQASYSRRYHPSQGRWESPDDGIPDPYNPQTLNAYHYSLNMPTTVTDPNGRDEMGGDGGTPCPMCNLVFDPRYTAEIDQEYFDAASRAAAVWHSSGIAGALYPQVIAQQMAQIDRNLVGNPTPGSLAQNQGQSNGNVDLTTITYAPNKDNTGVNILLGANVKNSSDKELNWIQSITTNAPNPGKPANTPYLDTPPVGAPTIFYYHSGDMQLFARAHNTTGYRATFFDAPSKNRADYPNVSTIKFRADLRLVGINSNGNYHTLMRISYGFTLDAKGLHPQPLRVLP